MKCTKCGNELKPNVPFCGNCGNRVEKPQEQPAAVKPEVQKVQDIQPVETQPKPQSQPFTQPQPARPQQYQPGQPPRQGNAQPYGQPPRQGNAQPYGQPPRQGNAQPYGQPPRQGNGQPYGQPPRQPYGQPPYGQPPYGQPYGQPPQNWNPPANAIKGETSVATVVTFLGFTALAIFAIIGMLFFGIIQSPYNSDYTADLFQLLEGEEAVILFVLFDGLAALTFLILTIIGIVKLCTKRNSAVWKLMGGSSIALLLAELATIGHGLIWISESWEGTVELCILPIIMAVVFFITMILGFALSGKFRQR